MFKVKKEKWINCTFKDINQWYKTVTLNPQTIFKSKHKIWVIEICQFLGNNNGKRKGTKVR